MTTTALTEKPEHVPAHLVVDYDVYTDFSLLSDSRDSARWSQGAASIVERLGPIFWTPRNGGHWVVGGYHAVYEVAQDTETFSSDRRKHPKFSHETGAMIPIGLDPPVHGKFKGALVGAMSPKIVKGLTEGIRAFAASLVANFANDGRADAMAQFAEPLPVVVILKLLGLPTDRLHEFRALMVALVSSPDPKDSDRILKQMQNVCAPFIRERMIKREDDMISRFLDTRIDGRETTFEEVMGYCTMVFAAGLDTVVNSLSFGLHHLAKDQAFQARLRADFGLIPAAVEEFVRRYSLVNNHRYVMRDREFYGVQLKRLDKVLYSSPAANLDHSVYAHALEMDLEREDSPHLGFFVGPHRCAGSHLARAEMVIAYEEFFKAVPQFRLDPEKPVEQGMGIVYSLRSVPLIWDVDKSLS